MTVTITQVSDPAECFALRHTVFVKEQGVPETLERDEFDATALHLLACKDGAPVGTARIVVTGETGKIGRVCVVRSARGTGLGAALICAAVACLRDTPGVTRTVLGAQLSALGFYEKLGFTAYGPVFDDAGIAHRMMAMALDG